jgi:methylated-DNA-[protein]-cysteine S-methyltransferase
VISLSFPESPEPGAGGDHEILDWVARYLAGAETDVTDIEVGLTVPTDQRTVLETVREIPYGESLAFERLVARSPGLDPDAGDDLETARTALAENPIPLLIPDHRVRDGPWATPASARSVLTELEGL